MKLMSRLFMNILLISSTTFCMEQKSLFVEKSLSGEEKLSKGLSEILKPQLITVITKDKKPLKVTENILFLSPILKKDFLSHLGKTAIHQMGVLEVKDISQDKSVIHVSYVSEIVKPLLFLMEKEAAYKAAGKSTGGQVRLLEVFIRKMASEADLLDIFVATMELGLKNIATAFAHFFTKNMTQSNLKNFQQLHLNYQTFILKNAVISMENLEIQCEWLNDVLKQSLKEKTEYQNITELIAIYGNFIINHATEILNNKSIYSILSEKPLKTLFDDFLKKQPEIPNIIHNIPSPITSVAWDPTNNYIAAAREDGIITVYNLKTQKIIELRGQSGVVYSIAFTSVGNLISGSSIVKLWDLSTESVINTFDTGKKRIKDISVALTSPLIAVSDESGTIHILDAKNLNPINIKLHHNFPEIKAIALNPNGNILAYSEFGSPVGLWTKLSLYGSTATSFLPSNIGEWTLLVDLLAWGSNNLLAFSDPQYFGIYDMEAKKIINLSFRKNLFIRKDRTFEGYDLSLAWQNHGNYIALGTNNALIKFYNVQYSLTHAPLKIINSDKKFNSIISLAWNPTNTLLLAGATDDTISTLSIWNVEKILALEQLLKRPPLLYQREKLD